MPPRATRLEVFHRDQLRCVCCGAPAAIDVDECHHRRLRSQGGSDALGNLITLTGIHHARWHSRRIEAHLRGLIVPSWADPLAVPVLHFELGWAIPGDFGWTPAEPLEWQAA
jgi:hypothetical protein